MEVSYSGCPCQHTCGYSPALSVYFHPSHDDDDGGGGGVVSEVREQSLQPCESLGGEHKEVGPPPTGALLRNMFRTCRPEAGGRNCIAAFLHYLYEILLIKGSKCKPQQVDV